MPPQPALNSFLSVGPCPVSNTESQLPRTPAEHLWGRESSACRNPEHRALSIYSEKRNKNLLFFQMLLLALPKPSLTATLSVTILGTHSRALPAALLCWPAIV